MKYDDMKANTSNIYTPSILAHDEPSQEHSGTEIKLEDIRRSSNFDANNIVENLSKRFTIFSDEFKVAVKRNDEIRQSVTNEQYISTTAQFKWIFPEDYTQEQLGAELFTFAQGKKISGTIYTSQTPLTIDKRGIALFSRGKLVQENTSFNDRGNDNFFQYMAGIFSIDFIDADDDKDFISTDRKSIVWDSDNNDDLIKIQEIMKKIVAETQKKWRRERKSTRIHILEEKGMQIDDWLKDLTASERPLAKKLAQSIIENDKIANDDAVSYLGYIKDMFSIESFKEFTDQLDKMEALGDEKAIKLLTDWQLIEAKEMAKIAEGRLKTIDQFEKYIKQNVSETKVMQKFLEEFPWLLDPKMSSFEREVTYGKLLKEHFSDADLPLSNRRIDFLCSNNAGTVHIIELKRPEIKLSEREIFQATSYLTFMTDHFPDTIKDVHAILISNRPEMKSSVKSIYESLHKDGKLSIKSYDDLLAQARFYNKEFINKYDNLREMHKKV